MKTLFAAILFSAFSLGAFAQVVTTQPAPAQKTISAPVNTRPTKATVSGYRCPVCGITSNKAGDCPKDKIALVKIGDYYCPDCYMTSTKPGKCSMCGVDMKKMEGGTASAVKK